jgi:hypothetical protein
LTQANSSTCWRNLEDKGSQCRHRDSKRVHLECKTRGLSPRSNCLLNAFVNSIQSIFTHIFLDSDVHVNFKYALNRGYTALPSATRHSVTVNVSSRCCLCKRRYFQFVTSQRQFLSAGSAVPSAALAHHTYPVPLAGLAVRQALVSARLQSPGSAVIVFI